jgi:DNA Polymerase alpha zinc finger
VSGCCHFSASFEVYNHFKYLASVFDVDHALEQWEKKKVFGAKKDLLNSIHKDDRKTFEQLHEEAKRALEDSAFHWIAPPFWNEFFCVGAKQQKSLSRLSRNIF